MCVYISLIFMCVYISVIFMCVYIVVYEDELYMLNSKIYMFCSIVLNRCVFNISKVTNEMGPVKTR